MGSEPTGTREPSQTNDNDDEFQRLCRISYTIMSATWLGRRSAADKAAIERKRKADRQAVDAILAGFSDPAIRAERTKGTERASRDERTTLGERAAIGE